MKEKLKEIVAKAVNNLGSYPDLTLVYQRGHDLSGITRFEMREDCAFTLTTNNPRRQSSAFFEGELEVGQRHAILTAIEETRILDIPSSTRNIGDDELPVVVELGYEDLRYRLLIWAKDALGNAEFHRFERTLWPLLGQLSDGKVGAGPSVMG